MNTDYTDQNQKPGQAEIDYQDAYAFISYL
jgi:hypothetical protein